MAPALACAAGPPARTRHAVSNRVASRVFLPPEHLALDLSHFAIMLAKALATSGGVLRIISRRRLREFWQRRRHDAAIAERDLSVWHKAARSAQWANFGQLRQTFGVADQVGNCIVFDVGNNRFRLIGRINYRRGIIYVLRVMDHDEYDKQSWVEECGCDRPPPPRPVKRVLPTAKRRPRWSQRKGG